MVEQRRWVRGFFREVISIPRQHMFVFLLATLLLIIVEVEVIEGWHLVRVLEIIGIVLFIYLGWAAWRVSRGLTAES